jgi:hypothetical protein
MSKVAKVALVGGGLALLGLGATAATELVTEWSGELGWIATPVVTVLGAALTAVLSKQGDQWADGDQRRPPPGYPPQYRGQAYPPGGATYRPPSRRRSSMAAVLVAVVTVAVLCVGATFGVRYAVGLISGDETGTSVLVGQASGTAAKLKVTVLDVVYTDHFTKVTLQVHNNATTSTSLPLFGFCTLTGADGTTLQADPNRSDWQTSFAPSVTQRGTVTFPGRLPPSDTIASLSFSTVFAQVPGDAALTVQGIQLAPDKAAAMARR